MLAKPVLLISTINCMVRTTVNSLFSVDAMFVAHGGAPDFDSSCYGLFYLVVCHFGLKGELVFVIEDDDKVLCVVLVKRSQRWMLSLLSATGMLSKQLS